MTMIPRTPPFVSGGGTPTRRNNLPVVGTGQWSEHGQQAAWLLGRGGTLVCSGPDLQQMTAGNVYEFRFKTLPHAQNSYRLWCVSLSADDGGASGMCRSLDGVTDYMAFDVPAIGVDIPGHTSQIVTFVTDDADDSVDGNGHTEFGFEIAMDSASSGYANIVSIGCYELPMVYAAPGDFPNGTYVFPPVESLQSGQPIYDDEGDPSSVGPAAVLNATTAAETDARRVTMCACHVLDSVQETGSTFVDAYGGEIPLLARKRYSADGAANRGIKVWVYAIGVGQVRLTMTNGSTATLNYSAPSGYEWQVADLDVDAENMSTLATDGGLRSSTRDTLLVELRCTDTVLAIRCVMAGEID